MRVLLITDIHANLVALEAVVKDAGEVDAVWCLGDVGWGGVRIGMGMTVHHTDDLEAMILCVAIGP